MLKLETTRVEMLASFIHHGSRDKVCKELGVSSTTLSKAMIMMNQKGLLIKAGTSYTYTGLRFTVIPSRVRYKKRRVWQAQED